MKYKILLSIATLTTSMELGGLINQDQFNDHTNQIQEQYIQEQIRGAYRDLEMQESQERMEEIFRNTRINEPIENNFHY